MEAIPSDTDSDQVLAISVLGNRLDAEYYSEKQALKINGLLLHLVEGVPVCRTFDVASFSNRDLSTKRVARHSRRRWTGMTPSADFQETNAHH